MTLEPLNMHYQPLLILCLPLPVISVAILTALALRFQSPKLFLIGPADLAFLLFYCRGWQAFSFSFLTKQKYNAKYTMRENEREWQELKTLDLSGLEKPPTTTVVHRFWFRRIVWYSPWQKPSMLTTAQIWAKTEKMVLPLNIRLQKKSRVTSDMCTCQISHWILLGPNGR